MSSSLKLIEDILIALQSIQGQSPASLIKGDAFQLPRLIPAASPGSTIQITKDIDDLISRLAQTLKSARPNLARSIKDDEWRNWVRTTLGPLLATFDLSGSATNQARPLLDKLEDTIGDIVASLDPREYAVGTTLFSNEDVPLIEIGPVRIEPRAAWLDRKTADGDVTAVAQRRIMRIWAGERVGPRKQIKERLYEKAITDAIGSCPYVCSVKLSASFAPHAGLETALTAARLALTCVALAFEKSSEALKGFNLCYDGPIHSQSALLFVPGKRTLPGFRLSGYPHGPYIPLEDWKAQVQQLHDPFMGCAEVLNNLVDPARSTARPELLEALLQGLIWFEKGCREVGDHMATLAFAASLDALGKGQKVHGILNMLEARLGISRNDPINADGPTFQTVLNEIYSDSRSRTIHGTSDKIGYDHASTRGRTQQIARYALIACLGHTARTPTATETDDLKK